RTDGRKDALFAQIGDEQRDLPEPGGCRGDRLRRHLDAHRRISDTVHIYLLVGNSFVLPHQGGIFLRWSATGYISLRNSWALRGLPWTCEFRLSLLRQRQIIQSMSLSSDFHLPARRENLNPKRP